MKHLFDVEFAAMYGLNSAIIFENIAYWVRYNEANEQNYHNGKYWTYNSRKAYKELFPYLSEKQIYTAITLLIKEGLIEKGCYNKIATDRTAWYTLTDKGNSIVQNGTMPLSLQGQSIVPTGTNNTIINNTDINYIPDINSNNIICPFEEVWKLYPSKKGKSKVSKKALTEMQKSGWDVVKKAVENYKAEMDRIRRGGFNRQYMDGSTFFNGSWKDWINVEPEKPNTTANYNYDNFFELLEEKANGGNR